MSAAASPSAAPASRARGGVACRLARSRAELDQHFAVRRAVFVEEQALFAGDDRDEHDGDPATLHAVGALAGVIGGAVRLYALEPPCWKGDRLAVLLGLRRGLLGAALVRFAVRTAGARGGHVMVAMIQLGNVGFFEELGWRRDGAVVRYHGVEHQPMAIGLRPGRRGVSRRPAR